MNTLLFSVISLPIFVALDYVWLGILMRSFYIRELGPLARQSIQYPSAAIAYCLMAVSVAVFILPRFIGQPVSWKVFALGALLGVVIYGVYDFTNHATLTHWSSRFMIVDILWGGVVYGLTATLSFIALRALHLL